MENKQEFWEKLKVKYEEKNRILQQRERELRLKLEALNSLIGDSEIATQETGQNLPAETFSSQPPPDFKSCTCAQVTSEEKGGFFKCLFSAFGSSKQKSQSPAKASPEASLEPTVAASPPSSPPLQDIPTKDYGHVDSYKNENCMCDPCIVDEPQKTNQYTSAGNNNVCNCSICSRTSSVSKQSEGSCDSKTCGARMSPLNKTAKEACPCDYAQDIALDEICVCATPTEMPYPVAQSNPLTNATNQNANSSNIKYNNKPAGMFTAPSNFSLKSLDLQYMKNIYDLATTEKNLMKEINDLEQKTKIYQNVFAEYKNLDFSAKKEPEKCICANSPPSTDSDQKTNAELKLENFLLKNELKDMRLEVRQYLERMEGPMQFKIESERYKCIQLEKKLEEAEGEQAKLQEFYQKEINSLKMELCSANTNIYHLNSAKEQLTQNLQEFQKKCTKLEEDLIRQKISEADTIRSLQAALTAQANANVVQEECDLHQIARELSKILKECEPCGDCITLPDDLTAAAKLLKSLTDMVDSKLMKSGEDKQSRSAEPYAFDTTPVQDKTSTSPQIVDKISQMSKKESTAGNALNEVEKEIELQIEEVSAKQPSVKSESHAAADVESNVRHSHESTDQSKKEEQPSVKSELVSSAPEEPEAAREEKLPSTKSDGPEAQIQSIHDTLEPDKTSRKSEAGSKSVRSKEATPAGQESAVEQPTPPSKTKKGCKCSKSKKITEIDQIWPKTDAPVVFKDSGVLETPREPKKKKCECSIAKKLKEQQQKKLQEQSNKIDDAPKGGAVDQSKSERFKLCHHVEASKSKDLLKSETSVKCLKVKENFPFDIDTQVDVFNRPPDGVHVTTTITNSGTLEVITEGPEGVIETTLVYTQSGNVEVVTEILEYQGKGKGCKRRKMKTPAVEDTNVKALMPPEDVKTSVSEPGKTADETGNLQVDAVKSGPTVMNANCGCKECPSDKKKNSEIDASAEPPAVPSKQPQEVETSAAPVDEDTGLKGDEVPPTELAESTKADQPADPNETAQANTEEKIITTEAQLQEPEEVLEVKTSQVIKSLSLSMHAEDAQEEKSPEENENENET